MSFPSPASAGDKTKMRADGYWNRPLVVLCQNTVVFACRANEDITDAPFAEFAYDTVTVGAFADALPGMVFYISSTSDIRDAKYRGRVRKTLTGSVFYCDENATILNDGDFVFVVRDVDLFAKVRRNQLMDFDIPYHNLEPQIRGLPSVEALYDADDDGVVSFAPTQSGIAVADGASISAWLWTISGDGTTAFTSGSSTSQNPVIELEAGFEYLIRCRVTDSNSIQHFQFIRVYAVDFNFTSLVVSAIVGGNISHDVENGFIGNVTAYADVNAILDRTHVTVFRIEHFGTGNEDSVLTNVMMCGRLRSEASSTAGDPDAGRIKETTFPVEGIVSYLQRLRVPNDIIRASAAPDEWGEMVEPDVYRALCYMMSNYTTLTNICSFDAGSTFFRAWQLGGVPSSADGGYALDVIKTMLDKIKASANYAPTGEIFMQVMASYQADRSAIQTIMDFDESEGDYRGFDIERDSSRTVAQVTAYGGMYQSVNNVFIYFTATAPSILYGDAPEIAELTRELIETDSSTTDAIAEIGLRAANHFAFINPKPLLRATFKSGLSGILVASMYQRWTHTIAASANTRGIAYTNEDYWQLQAVNIDINTDGTLEVSGDFIAETEFTDAQSIAGLLPINLEGMNPVLPVLSDDPSFPDDPLWMYPTDTPSADELQPIGAYSAYLSYSPFTPDQAAQAAAQQPQPGCFVTQVNMRNPGTTLGDATVNTDPYLMQISGWGQISSAAWQHHVNFTNEDGGFTPDTNYVGVTSAWVSGTGWTKGVVGVVAAVDIHFILAASTSDATDIRFLYDVDVPANVNVVLRLLGVQVYNDIQSATIGTGQTYISPGPFPEFDEIVFQCTSLDTSGNPVITGYTVAGNNTNPFTGDPATDNTFADAFYFWFEGDEETAQVFGATAGLLIDGSKPAVIPDYRPDHVYGGIPYTGTGNPLQLNFALSDYTDVQNKLLTVVTCENP